MLPAGRVRLYRLPEMLINRVGADFAGHLVVRFPIWT
jgi:hypothetical protein